MIALMYHDVVEPGAEDTSGFPGTDAALYKVSPALFEAHLDAIAAAVGRAPLAITFDDGGVSALRAADALEARGLHGHFFVTANYVGTRGFVDARDMRELVARGHVIGSHSCSHPLRMGHCPPERLRHEWARSRDILSSALGQPIVAASVPGGDFAPQVAEAAAEAGFVELFTSEPTTHDCETFGLTLHGRFAIRRWTSASTVAALAAGRTLPRAAQAFAWNIRKLGKRLAGDRYLQLRQLLLRPRPDVRWGDGEPGQRAAD